MWAELEGVKPRGLRAWLRLVLEACGFVGALVLIGAAVIVGAAL